jgi:hypothetical protein
VLVNDPAGEAPANPSAYRDPVCVTEADADHSEGHDNTVASKSLHFRSVDGGLTLCRLESSRIANANLPSTPDIALVTCRGCLIQFKHEQRKAQQSAELREPLPITRMPANLATKADIEDLKMELMRLREQVQAVAMKVQLPAPPTRYMDTAACAIYIGRSVGGVRALVDRGHIPVSKLGRKLQFDRERSTRGYQDMPIAARWFELRSSLRLRFVTHIPAA